jgi:hypothetical protein
MNMGDPAYGIHDKSTLILGIILTRPELMAAADNPSLCDTRSYVHVAFEAMVQ